MTIVISQTEPKKRSRRFYIILVAAVLSVAIIVGLVIFELSNVGHTSYGPGPVDIEVTTDKPFYLQGEEVYFTIYVNNQQDWPVRHPSLVQYQIEKDGLWIDGCDVNIDYPVDRVPSFPAHSRTLYPKNWLWNQKMYLNETLVQVQPGNYTLTVSFHGPVDYGDGGNCTIEIKSKP